MNDNDSEILKEKGAEIARQMGSEAISKLLEQFADTADNEALRRKLQELWEQGIDEVVEGKEYADVLKDGAQSAGIWLAEQCVEKIFSEGTAAEKERETAGESSMPSDNPEDVLKTGMSSVAKECIVAYINGNKNIQEVFEQSVKSKVTDLVTEKGTDFIRNTVREQAVFFKKKGRAYRQRNKEIDCAGDIIGTALAQQVFENLSAWQENDKTALQVVQDTAVQTGKNVAEQYLRERGADLATKMIKSMVTAAENNIGNQAVRQVTVGGLKKLAGKNAVTKLATAVVDLKDLIGAYSRNEITEAELLRKVGEEGAGVVLSSACAAVITPIAGTAASVAIAPMLGYMASEVLFKSVLTSMERAKAAKEREQIVRAMVEESIARMKKEREEFERVTAQFFAHRQKVIDNSFRKIDEAFVGGDFDKLSEGLNDIAVEFGRELQFKNFAEFDVFMSDADSVLKL